MEGHKIHVRGSKPGQHLRVKITEANADYTCAIRVPEQTEPRERREQRERIELQESIQKQAPPKTPAQQEPASPPTGRLRGPDLWMWESPERTSGARGARRVVKLTLIELGNAVSVNTNSSEHHYRRALSGS